MVIVVLLLLDWMTVSSRVPCGAEIWPFPRQIYVFSTTPHLKIDFFPNFLVFSDPKLVKISWRHGLLKFNPFDFFLALFEKSGSIEFGRRVNC